MSLSGWPKTALVVLDQAKASLRIVLVIQGLASMAGSVCSDAELELSKYGARPSVAGLGLSAFRRF